ncbi:MAG TPA: hypothetical protein PLS51_08715 [Flavobacterium sp.]|nr:hypothetical protein [Flavobacterium sp.]HPJ10697.1 hypothetical protein [Flavobacterium sp.]
MDLRFVAFAATWSFSGIFSRILSQTAKDHCEQILPKAVGAIQNQFHFKKFFAAQHQFVVGFTATF